MSADGLRCLNHLRVGGPGMAVLDVIADGAREQERLLEHHAHLRRQRLPFSVSDVVAVNQYRPSIPVYIVEARDQ